jgi:hypothetical protein
MTALTGSLDAAMALAVVALIACVIFAALGAWIVLRD